MRQLDFEKLLKNEKVFIELVKHHARDATFPVVVGDYKYDEIHHSNNIENNIFNNQKDLKFKVVEDNGHSAVLEFWFPKLAQTKYVKFECHYSSYAGYDNKTITVKLVTPRTKEIIVYE